jgi:hypothetical protein
MTPYIFIDGHVYFGVICCHYVWGKWRPNVSPTCWYPSANLKGATSHQTVNFLREDIKFHLPLCFINIYKGQSILCSVQTIAASNRNEYQEYFLGVKAVGAYGWQPYHLHVPIVLKSGSLTFLEPSGLSRPVMGLLYLYKRYTERVNGVVMPSFHSEDEGEGWDEIISHATCSSGLRNNVAFLK